MRRRNYFQQPTEAGYWIINTFDTKIGMHDASRPFVIIERYWSGYKAACYRTSVCGRYSDVDKAKRRLRYLETR